MHNAKSSEINAAVNLLGISGGADIQDVIRARRLEAKKWHPDINSSEQSATRMGKINHACDILCDFIRKGGYVPGNRSRTSKPKPSKVYPQTIEAAFVKTDSLVLDPDRLARVEIGFETAMEGGIRRVSFVRQECGMCNACGGLGALPWGPKRICPECSAVDIASCASCHGRGWLHIYPGSCQKCSGTGAGLVERTVHIKLPSGINCAKRVKTIGWGDMLKDGSFADLFIDIVPSITLNQSAPWRFEYFGHDWPKPESKTQGEWLYITNNPLPDEEMRDLGFWRSSDSSWTRQTASDGSLTLIDLIHQRQHFIPNVSSDAVIPAVNQ
jgi:hypothetical protein